MQYRLEQWIDGAWKLLKEVSGYGSWSEIARFTRGSFRLVNVKTGLAEREVHS